MRSRSLAQRGHRWLPRFLDDAGDKDACKSNALADEEGARKELGLEGVEGMGLALDETSMCLDIE